MFFYLSKILQYLLTPIIWVLIIFTAGIIIKTIQTKKALFLSGFIMLLLFSNMFIQDEFMRWWEVDTTAKTELKITYDYGIVLTGMISYDSKYERINFLRSTDRILQALELYKEGYIKKIFISGGSGNILNQEHKESLILYNYLVKIGIPAEDILVEEISRNTYENAVESARILKPEINDHSYLLITSAFHMRRANSCFTKAGFSCDVYVTDRYAGDRRFRFDHLIIPNIHAVERWTLLLHETSGYIMYKIMGYC